MFKKFNRKFFGAKIIFVGRDQYSGEELIEEMEILPGSPVIVFMGGAAKMSPAVSDRVKLIIDEGVARAAVELKATVVDGGTDSGTMGMLNASLGERDHKGYYIGVSPGPLTHLPNHPTNGHLVPLGGAHTHFVLVEGGKWGDELNAMYALANALAEGVHSLGILVNGGKGTENEMIENIVDERKVVVLEGSGRLADKISVQLHRPGTFGDTNINNISKDGDFIVFDITQNPDQLVEKIKAYLSPA